MSFDEEIRRTSVPRIPQPEPGAEAREQDRWAEDEWYTDEGGQVIGGAPPGFVFVAKSSLDARERELEALKRMMPSESSVLVPVVDLEAVGRRAEKAEAHEAVLVEALKGWALGEWDWRPGDPLLDAELAPYEQAIFAALAGVVEAEPENPPWCCPICGGDCSHLLAELDGSER